MSHDHGAGFDLSAGYVDPEGREGIDTALLGRFIGAALDGCTTCQDAELTLMCEDAATTARLVELACVSVMSTLGGLPRNMYDQRAPGLTSNDFRWLASAGMDGNNARMFELTAHMTPARRRGAANDAADILVGVITSGG